MKTFGRIRWVTPGWEEERTLDVDIKLEDVTNRIKTIEESAEWGVQGEHRGVRLPQQSCRQVLTTMEFGNPEEG